MRRRRPFNVAPAILDAGELLIAVRSASSHDLAALPDRQLRHMASLVGQGIRAARQLERRIALEVARRNRVTSSDQ